MKSRWLWLIVLAAIVGTGLWLRTRSANARTTPPSGPAAVPVAAARAVRGDIPVYYNGLGSVTPYYTVAIHTRVDGQLMDVRYREGQFVHAGDLLAEIDPRPFQVQLEQAEAQLQRDQALLANARIDLARYAALTKENAIPRQQYDTQVATVGQDEGSVKSDQAAIDNAKLQLAYCRIEAPIDGRIGLRLVDPGNIVHATDTTGLLVITQMQPITVIFTLPEDDLFPILSRSHAGESLAVDAYSRDMSRKLDSGHLLAADNQIDQNTGTDRLRAVFPNRGSTLYPNQFVNVRILVEVRHRQVIVPSVAIQRGPEGTFVYVVKPDHTVEVRPVTVGISEGIRTSIASGLGYGETVITDGAENLRPGSRVTIRPEVPPAPGGAAAEAAAGGSAP